MLRTIFICLFLSLLFWQCDLDIQPGKIRQLLEPPRQTFVIKTGRDTSITCAGGTVLKFCANTFRTDAAAVTLEVQEVLSRSDMLGAGVSTRSTDGLLLESEGMIYLNATEPAGVGINPDCPVEIHLPAAFLNGNMVLFKGVEKNETIEWESICNDTIPGICPFTNKEELNVLREGKILFTRNCAACHCCDLATTLTGPALGNITQYRDARWLRDFTRQSQRMVQNGDSLATCLWNRWKPVLMPDFQQLKDHEIDAIYAWIASESARLNVALDAADYACVPGESHAPAPAVIKADSIFEGQTIPISRAKKAREEKLTNYMFKAYEFGWYNCDVFLDISTEAELTVQVTDVERYDDILVSLIYDRRKINLPLMQIRVGEQDATFSMGSDNSSVLAFEPARLVAVAMRGNKWYLAEQPIEIKEKNEVILTLNRLSKKEVDAVFRKKAELTPREPVIVCPCEIPLQSQSKYIPLKSQ